MHETKVSEGRGTRINEPLSPESTKLWNDTELQNNRILTTESLRETLSPRGVRSCKNVTAMVIMMKMIGKMVLR